MRVFRKPLAGIALAAGLATACAGSTSPPAQPSPTSAASPTASAAAPTAAEIEALYRARQDSLRMRYTKADVDFMTGMIGHHAQALVMSALAPTHGASATIQTLAARITNSQKDEIAIMQRWLRDREQTVPEDHIDGTNKMIHGAGHGMMPGKLTPEQMDQLAEARGGEFDRLFLTLMIQHHRGAVSMVRELFATDGAGQDEAVF
jgi:uncharacterized protein (DUF305 family)